MWQVKWSVIVPDGVSPHNTKVSVSITPPWGVVFLTPSRECHSRTIDLKCHGDSLVFTV